MERDVLWSHLWRQGFEHLRLTQHDNEIVADGLIISVGEHTPFRARYTVRCDPLWRVRAVNIELLDNSSQGLALQADGAGHWTSPSGDPLPFLDGCIDVDITLTPFTNTLPIRRLGPVIGISSEIAVAYMKVPEMQVEVARQRYTCLDLNARGGVYRYESMSTGFTAELVVDSDALVIDYPAIFRRVWPAATQ